MRFFDIMIFVVVMNLVFTFVNSVTFYYDNTGTGHTLGPTFQTNPNLIPEKILQDSNASCVRRVNGSYSCTYPSQLETSPSITPTSIVFGFIYPGVNLLFSVVGVGGFVYTTLNDIGIPSTFSIIVGGAIDVIFVLALVGIFTGRWIET